MARCGPRFTVPRGSCPRGAFKDSARHDAFAATLVLQAQQLCCSTGGILSPTCLNWIHLRELLKSKLWCLDLTWVKGVLPGGPPACVNFELERAPQAKRLRIHGEMSWIPDMTSSWSYVNHASFNKNKSLIDEAVLPCGRKATPAVCWVEVYVGVAVLCFL